MRSPRTQPPRTGLPRTERGSAAIEAVVGLPAFALLVGLIICGGRVATTHEGLQSAAAEAARSASIARDPRTATDDARHAATRSITNQDIHCHGITVRVDTSDFHKQPGQAGAVKVTVSCRLDLSDLSVPGVPGSRLLTATMTSPLDTWRQS
jgi:Flp pilus assembly protein TadG